MTCRQLLPLPRLPGLLVTGALLLAAAPALADTVMGVPVTAIGSVIQAVPTCPSLEGNVCFNAATGTTRFFVPLSSATSGTYGVTDTGSGKTAGTFADSGTGTSDALTMYLLFAPLSLPATSASLTFQFADLDLWGVNDPYGFFEAVRFYSQSGVAITPLITTNGQSETNPLPFTVVGNSSSQSIFFSDVTSILQDPFYLELRFSSRYYINGMNTPESMTAKLDYTPAVPEPATLLLMGSGLLGAAGARLRKRRAQGAKKV